MMAGSKLRSRLPAMEAKRYKPMPDHFPDAGEMVDQQSAQSEAPMTDRMIWPPLREGPLTGLDAIDYGRACALAALEAAIRLCEETAEEYQRTQGMKYPELKDDAQTGATSCEWALRKLKDSL